MNTQTRAVSPLNVQTTDCPDSTYFRASDIRPEVSGNTLTVTDGRGSRRSWGAPSVDSRVSRIADDVYKVEVTGWHKHTVGPVGGSYYFVFESGQWTRRTANYGKVKAALAN